MKVTSGYAGGQVKDPTYEQVSAGGTGHRESVEILYDPRQIGYAKLLDVFWHNVDPTNDSGQFCDQGPQYRSAIFYHDDEQKAAAEASKAERDRSGRYRRPIVTEITPASQFYEAEDYHQQYLEKRGLASCHIG